MAFFLGQKGDKISKLSYSQLKKMNKETVHIKYLSFLLLSFLEDWKQIKIIFKIWQKIIINEVLSKKLSLT